MKKYILMILLTFMCIVTGCSSSNKDVLTGTNTETQTGYKLYSKITYTFENKKIASISEFESIINDTIDQYASAKTSAKKYVKQIKDIKGVTAKVTSNKSKKKVSFYFSVDISKYSEKKDEMSIFSAVEKKDITIKKIIKRFKSFGYVTKLNGKKQ